MTRANHELVPKIVQQGLEARSAILHMTTISASGHPGGSMSSIDMLLCIYNTIHHDPKNPELEDRDRVVVSIGHVSPAVYSALGLFGYFPLEDAIAQFRQFGSIYEGHIERDVPGVEWSSGNLGQGLSAATGFAIASRIKGFENYTYVLMGDGEQQKGQISEARRFAVKYHLNHLIAIVDYNQLQISGSIHDVMPQNIRKSWEADGWQVLEVNGHDIPQVLECLHEAKQSDKPVMILAHTVMGKGISFMENLAKYHGSTLSEEQCKAALAELKVTCELDKYKAMRQNFIDNMPQHKGRKFQQKYELIPGKPTLYTIDNDCRSAWGSAMADLGKINADSKNPIVLIDCDLASSVKTSDFKAAMPDRFLQTGIMEHHACVMGGAISTTGIQCFWSDFGMFGIDEVYNMQRLNDINHANLKTVVTHVGIDVGADGKTHQCIDYISLVRNLFTTRLICPADANQTDKVMRWLIDKPGNYIVTMGRSKLPILKTTDSEILYGQNYCYEYGKADTLREGNIATLFVTGTPASRALRAIDILREEGVFIQLVYISTPLDIDPEVVAEASMKGNIYTVEDHSVHGGLATSIAEILVAGQHTAQLIKMGVDRYPNSGESDDLFEWAGIDTASIVRKIKASLE